MLVRASFLLYTGSDYLMPMRSAFSRFIATFPGRKLVLPVAVFALVGIFGLAAQAHAAPLTAIESAAITMIGAIAVFFGWACTQILLFLTEMLVAVAGYNGFATSGAVERGWVIVRDLTNMFFILVMLIIAFGTILGVEEYSYKRMLPRLLIMAVVINFSKVICGLLIDFSQVVMLTFVNGFSAIAGGNFVRMFHVSSVWELTASATAEAAESSAAWSALGSLILAGVLMMTAAVAVFIMTLMLVGRIVMLWLLIVMSPLAFFLSAFPKGKAAEMYGKWWGMFGNYVIIGPFIAFFLWLSLAVAGSGSIAQDMQITREGGPSLFVTAAGQNEKFYSFVIAIALLMGGMSMSAQFGVMGGSMMAGAAQAIQQKGIGAVKGAGRLIGRTARLADSTITARTGVGVGTILSIPRNIGAGTEARIKDNYEKGKKNALSSLREGGVGGRVKGFLGASDEVARKSGIIGFTAGTAALAAASGYRRMKGEATGVRGRDAYLSKAEEAQGDVDAAKGNREAAQRMFKEQKDLYENATASPLDRAAMTRLGAQRAGAGEGTPLATALDTVLAKARAGESIKESEIAAVETAGGASDTTAELMNQFETRGQNFQAYQSKMQRAQAQINDFSSQEAAAKGRVDKWTKGAERASVGGFGPEMPKHAMDATVTSSMLTEALKSKDFTLAQQLIVKLGEDNELGEALKLRKDSNGKAHGEGLEGVKSFAKELMNAQNQMPRGMVMAALSEVDSKYKAKGNTVYSGMVKGGPGGRLRFVSNVGDSPEYGQGRLKSGGKGNMGSTLREANRTSTFQVPDGKGGHVIDAAGAVLIAQSIGDIVKTVENNRMSGDMMRMFVDKNAEVMKSVVDAGVEHNGTQYKALEAAIGKMTEQLKSVPPDVGRAISNVYAARAKRGA
ncbi:MAG: hypothetical protein AAB974_01170 [Patescibacteria group bacterium]